MFRAYLPTANDGKQWHFIHNLTRPLAERARSRKHCGPYYSFRRVPALSDTIGFYANDDDGTPGDACFHLRADLADVNHNGWYTDDDGMCEPLRPVRYRLPHGRGFLAGWTAGSGMYSAVDANTIYSDESSADAAADSMAEYAAESERDYRAEHDNQDDDDDTDD